MADQSEKQAFAEIRTAMLEIREGLAGKEYLGDAFSFDDFAIACFLQRILPVSDDYLRIRKATRRAWTVPEIADVMQWRDRIYGRHRRCARASGE